MHENVLGTKGKDVEILIQAAQAGGKVLRKYFGQVLGSVVEKSTLADFQTEADLESEKSILTILKSNFPDYNIHSEEEGKLNKGSEYTLVIDPMDGTGNFMASIPNFSVSIALFHKNEAIAGVIYQPMIDQTFFAVKGEGAYLDGKKIGVNDVVDTNKITIAYICGYTTLRDYLGNVMNSLFNSANKRIVYNWSGAYDYCLLASGRIESVITDGIELYDYAAGKLIALEAGAKIIDFTGKKETDYKNSHFILSNSNSINEHVFDAIKSLQENR